MTEQFKINPDVQARAKQFLRLLESRHSASPISDSFMLAMRNARLTLKEHPSQEDRRVVLDAAATVYKSLPAGAAQEVEKLAKGRFPQMFSEVVQISDSQPAETVQRAYLARPNSSSWKYLTRYETHADREGSAPAEL